MLLFGVWSDFTSLAHETLDALGVSGVECLDPEFCSTHVLFDYKLKFLGVNGFISIDEYQVSPVKPTISEVYG